MRFAIGRQIDSSSPQTGGRSVELLEHALKSRRRTSIPHLDRRAIRFVAAANVANLTTGMRVTAARGLTETIEPLLSRSVIEDGSSVCFSKARVSPSLVERSHAR
jgi:hypothetical protein